MPTVPEGFVYHTDKYINLLFSVIPIRIAATFVLGRAEDYDMLAADGANSDNSLVIDGVWRYLRWNPGEKTLVFTFGEFKGSRIFCGAYQRAGNIWTFRYSPEWFGMAEGEVRSMKRNVGPYTILCEVQNPVDNGDDLSTDIWYRFTLLSSLKNVSDSQVMQSFNEFEV